MLTDIAMSGDGNVIRREAWEILKHEEFTIQIQHM
jgi:hypothetical protein